MVCFPLPLVGGDRLHPAAHLCHGLQHPPVLGHQVRVSDTRVRPVLQLQGDAVPSQGKRTGFAGSSTRSDRMTGVEYSADEVSENSSKPFTFKFDPCSLPVAKEQRCIRFCWVFGVETCCQRSYIAPWILSAESLGVSLGFTRTILGSHWPSIILKYAHPSLAGGIL